MMKFGEFRFRAILFAIALGFLVWGFRELLFAQMPTIFQDEYEEVSYGWFVPVFSLYVVWRERRELIASLGNPGWGGLLLTLPLLFVGFIGVRGIQVRFGIVAFAGLLFSLVWAFFGRAAAKRVLFPCMFLLFCMPLANFLSIFTVHLRLMTTWVATWLMRGFGADFICRGTAIFSADGSFSIDVAAPCSGLRSIFALVTLTAGYAYFNQPTWLRRGLLFVLSVPLAIIGNMMRIWTICIVGSVASAEFATGFYHDYSGYIVFIVAIALMVFCGEIIERAFRK